jgi:hypothetical protein
MADITTCTAAYCLYLVLSAVNGEGQATHLYALPNQSKCEAAFADISRKYIREADTTYELVYGALVEYRVTEVYCQKGSGQ